MAKERENLPALSEAELEQKITTSRQQLWQLRQQVAGQQLKNYRQIRLKRRQVARYLTEGNRRGRIKPIS